MFPRVFCFPKSRQINENGGKTLFGLIMPSSVGRRFGKPKAELLPGIIFHSSFSPQKNKSAVHKKAKQKSEKDITY